MTNLTRLDDMLRFKTGIIPDMVQFHELLKDNLAPAAYDSFLAQISGVEALRTFSFSEGCTYVLALDDLRRRAGVNQPKHTLSDGTVVCRPLTFKENMVARVENPVLFDKHLDSCTSVAYKGGTRLVKFTPISEPLLTLESNFNKSSLDINYSQVVGVELDVGKVSTQDLWLAAMGGDNSENRDLYHTYKGALHQRTNIAKDKLMNFYTLENLSKDHLRVVYQRNGDNYSYAGGYGSICGFARLLRVD